jgi:hypothetical protein
VAYHEILTVLAREVPALADARPVPIRARRRIIPGRGLAHLVGLENVFREEVVEIAPRFPRARLARGYRRSYSERLEGQQPVAFEVQDQGLPRAVVFRDSFGNALIPFLSEHFRRVLYVWRPNLEPAFVEEEQPDVVIHEIAERFLGRPPRGIREIVAGSDAPVEDVPSPP